MTTAYDRIYLPQARKNLGRMLDFGCLDLGFGVEAFWAHFLRSGVAERFGGGESRLLAGMSGIELAREVLECAGVSYQMPENPVCRDAKGPEYWAAWALAHYQWLRALPFAEIEASIPIRDVILMYDPYHEMDISGFVEEIDRRRMAGFGHGAPDGRPGVYLDLIEAAVAAYSDEHLARYVAETERDGVQEHGFPRLAANLGILLANGRVPERLETFERMMSLCCSDAAKGKMPLPSSGNEFTVKELVAALVAVEGAGLFPRDVTDAWRADLARIDASRCYSCLPPVGADTAYNWCVFGAARTPPISSTTTIRSPSATGTGSAATRPTAPSPTPASAPATAGIVL